jgi:hypothetical protein
MRSHSFFFIALILIAGQTNAQQEQPVRFTNTVELAGLKGNREGAIAGSYEHNWRLGKARRLEVGVGARWTLYTGNNKEFFTAPAQLAKGATGIPVFFKERIPANLDTILIPHPVIHSVNVTANIAYRLFPRFYVGFNIDVMGFSVGKKQPVDFIHDGVPVKVNARPAGFNLLKIDDNAIGSQNSEFYALYEWDRWALKAFYGLMYVEYKTEQPLQQVKGIQNDRFRDVPKGLGFGITYYLK